MSVKSHPDLTVIEGDVVNSADMQRCHDALGGVDLVHHLAAINGTKWFHEAAMDVIDVNVNGTLVALRHALEWGALSLPPHLKPMVKTSACRFVRKTSADFHRLRTISALFLRREQIPR